MCCSFRGTYNDLKPAGDSEEILGIDNVLKPTSRQSLTKSTNFAPSTWTSKSNKALKSYLKP